MENRFPGTPGTRDTHSVTLFGSQRFNMLYFLVSSFLYVLTDMARTFDPVIWKTEFTLSLFPVSIDKLVRARKCQLKSNLESYANNEGWPRAYGCALGVKLMPLKSTRVTP